MIFSEATLSYPCVKYKVEVSHYTARKSTAIEWVILEAIYKCESLTVYQGVPISTFFEQIFTISDADLLIRPCLISLQDLGAITIVNIDNETELSTVPMRNVKLTDSGREMQLQGRLPGANAEDTVSVCFDIAEQKIKDDAGLYKEIPTGIRVYDITSPGSVDFPVAAINGWLRSQQQSKPKNRMAWLTPTTNIREINSLDARILWKNISRKIEIVAGRRWKVSGMDDERLDEIVLNNTDLSQPLAGDDLPLLTITEPDEELEQLAPYSEANFLIGEIINNTDSFITEEKYYRIKTTEQQKAKMKKTRIIILYGAEKLQIDIGEGKLIVRIPDKEMGCAGLFTSGDVTVRAGIISVFAGEASKDVPVAYIPVSSNVGLLDIAASVVEKYYGEDLRAALVLYGFGDKESFIDFLERAIERVDGIGQKAKIIASINEAGRSCFLDKKNPITSSDYERLLVSETYIAERSNNVEGAINVITEYAGVNAIKLDDVLFLRIIDLAIDSMGVQNDIEEIWKLWQHIYQLKKSAINSLARSGVQRRIYSKKSIQLLLDGLADDEIFKVEAYTSVEQIIQNMRRIIIHMEEMLPGFDLYQPTSKEKYNEVILSNIDILNKLYEKVRQWKDEEERFEDKIIDFGEVMQTSSLFSSVRANMDGLRDALAVFFDDSFMRFSKVYVVDTCTLMHKPELISWFEGKKALLVVPMVVQAELDGLKASNDENEAYYARQAIQSIKNYREYDWLNISQESCPDLLPRDLDGSLNDNKILSIAIKYSAKRPVLLTDDINLGNLAVANKIETITSESYEAMLRNETKAAKGSKKKAKKSMR